MTTILASEAKSKVFGIPRQASNPELPFTVMSVCILVATLTAIAIDFTFWRVAPQLKLGYHLAGFIAYVVLWSFITRATLQHFVYKLPAFHALLDRHDNVVADACHLPTLYIPGSVARQPGTHRICYKETPPHRVEVKFTMVLPNTVQLPMMLLLKIVVGGTCDQYRKFLKSTPSDDSIGSKLQQVGMLIDHELRLTIHERLKELHVLFSSFDGVRPEDEKLQQMVDEILYKGRVERLMKQCGIQHCSIIRFSILPPAIKE